jgi:hypothetical protein
VLDGHPEHFFLSADDNGGEAVEGGRRFRLLAKETSSPVVQAVDVETGERRPDIRTAVGSMYVSASGCVAVIVDYDRERSVKIHRLDGVDPSTLLCKDDVGPELPFPVPNDINDAYRRPNCAASVVGRSQNGFIGKSTDAGVTRTGSGKCASTVKTPPPVRGRFLGHIVPTSQIEPGARDRHRLTHVCVSDTHVCLMAASSKQSRAWMAVGDLASCAVVFQTELPGGGHVTACALSRPDERAVYVAAGRKLSVFQLKPTVRFVGDVDVDDRPPILVFTKDGRRGFMCSGRRPGHITVLTLDTTDAATSKTTGRVVFQTTIDIGAASAPTVNGDSADSKGRADTELVEDLRLSNSDDYLLVRRRSLLVVFDMAQDRVLKTISRPPDVPSEFRLPRSGRYTALGFTQALFSADDCFIIGSIFRDIHIWPIAGYNSAFYGGGFASSHTSALPVATLRGTVGVIRELYVVPASATATSGSSLLVAVAGGGVDAPTMATRIDVWSVGDAVTSQAGAAPLDRLTSAIRDVIVTSDDRRAFVSAADSDEIGVVDMATGRMVDLMTHEAPVAAFSVTPSGDHVFVALDVARPGQFNKIWNTSCRKIILEYGDAGAYSVPLCDNSGFFAVGQATKSVSLPFRVTQFRLKDGDVVEQLEMDLEIPYVIDAPFLTPGDRYLIVFAAAAYDQPTAHYIEPRVSAVSLRSRSVTVTTYGPQDLRTRVPAVRRLLDVRPCPTNSYNVAVMFTNESDRVGGGPAACGGGVGTGLRPVAGRSSNVGWAGLEREGGGYGHNFGFLLLDVCSGVICQVIEDCFPPSTVFSRLMSNDTLQLFVDQDSNLFDMATGQCVATSLVPSDGVAVRQQKLALNGCALVAADRNQYVYVVRIADGKTLAHLCVHGDVTALELCRDMRTLVLGLADGSVLSYVIVDVESGDDRDAILSAIGTRQSRPLAATGCRGPTTIGGGSAESGSAGSGPRAWDKVDPVNGTAPDYARPPSAVLPCGPSDKAQLSRVGSRKGTDGGAAGDSWSRVRQGRDGSSGSSSSGRGSRVVSNSQLYEMSVNRSQTCLVM